MSTATQSLTVSEAAHSRRSIRAYTPEPIAPADLESILRETGMAPSALNLQPWRFVVVRDAEAKQRLAEVAYRQRQVTAAPAVIAIYTDMADTLAHLDEITRPDASSEQVAGFRKTIEGRFGPLAEAEREQWAQQQGYIALGYLLLVASGHGYATSAMGGFEPEGVKRVLDLPANARVVALVAIGHGAETGQEHHRLPLARTTRTI